MVIRSGTAVLDDGGRLLIFVSGEGEAQLASRGYPILNALNPVMISQKTEKFNEKRDTAISNTVGFHTAYTAVRHFHFIEHEFSLYRTRTIC